MGISYMKSVFLRLCKSTFINTSRSEKPDQSFIFHIFVICISIYFCSIAVKTGSFPSVDGFILVGAATIIW